MTALNAQEWYPVYDLVYDLGSYTFDPDLLARYDLAKAAFRSVLAELDAAYDAEILRVGAPPGPFSGVMSVGPTTVTMAVTMPTEPDAFIT